MLGDPENELCSGIPEPSGFGKRAKPTIGGEKSTGWLVRVRDIFGTAWGRQA